jgi:dTMP kinase
LSDRYVYTIFARYAVRGIDPDWIRKAYGFALVPHLVLYLDVDMDILAERALKAERMGFWESGMDLNLAGDFYNSFFQYQKRMLRQFTKMKDEFDFEVVSAAGSTQQVQQRLRKKVRAVLDLKDTEISAGKSLGPIIEGMDDD